MGADASRRGRLEELLHLAQAYRGWNRRQLARALQRDASNLVPASGLPKIDLVVSLANVLDWSVEDVVKSFWLNEVTAPTTVRVPADIIGLDQHVCLDPAVTALVDLPDEFVERLQHWGAPLLRLPEHNT